MNIKHLIRTIARAAAIVTVALGLPAIAQTGGTTEEILTIDHPKLRPAAAVQKTITTDLMKLSGVLGTAVSVDDSGKGALVVYVDQDSPSKADIVRGLPPAIRGVGVKVEMTDKFRAFGKPGGGSVSTVVSHTAIQTPPIQLGTSGGWSKDLANGYCCGGTLGSLVSINGVQHILSNYHVFESDIIPGGNIPTPTVATTGDPIIQPGLIDVGCNAVNAQPIATLVKKSSLPNSNVDCSIAQVVPGMVRTDGAILEIGAISSSTATASINQAVKKSGRTTRLSRSKVSGLNATISVQYDNECAGGKAFVKTFTGQIVIANRGGKFLAGGDSGSLMVEDVSTNPRAVGLLYAGSSTSAIANPIGDVLGFLGSKLGGTATMVGN